MQPILTNNTGHERRVDMRKSLHGRVMLVLENGSHLEGKGFDISIGGLSLVLDVALPKLTRCTAQLSLRDAAGKFHVWSSATVVANCSLCSAVGGFRVGLEWRQMPDAMRIAVDQFMRS